MTNTILGYFGVFVIGILMGSLIEQSVDMTGTEMDNGDVRVEMSKSRITCEKDLPRSQNCVLKWEIIPEKIIDN